MEPERTTWSNDEILQEVLTWIFHNAYKTAFNSEIREMLKEALDDENPEHFRRRLIDLQTSSLLELLTFVDGAIGPSIWPGIDLVNAETKERLSLDFQMSFSEAQNMVDNEYYPPITREDARLRDLSRIQELWEKGVCPIVTGIIFGNDQILYLDVPVLSLTPFPSVEEIGDIVEPILVRTSTVEEFVQEQVEFFTSLDATVRCNVHARNLAIVGGATSNGSEGFIAVHTLASNQIVWIAIFGNSNPFTHLTFETSSNTVIGTTSHDHVWKFPLTQPEKFHVTYRQK